MSDHDEIKRLSLQLDRYERLIHGGATGGIATVNVNAGGIATIIACVCLALTAFGTFWQQALADRQANDIREQRADIRELRAENRRLYDYVSVLYRKNPELQKQQPPPKRK